MGPRISLTGIANTSLVDTSKPYWSLVDAGKKGYKVPRGHRQLEQFN
jgi:hypothetical protein